MRWLLLLALLIAGCASTTPPSPTVPQRVEIPVPVPCKIPQIEKPSFAVDGLPIGSDIWDQMSALRAERKQRQGYEVKLEAAIKSCQ